MESQEKRRRLITISVPVYNEEDNIASLMKRLKAFSIAQPDYDFEFLFTDNASEDAGKVILKNINTPKLYADQLLQQMRRIEK